MKKAIFLVEDIQDEKVITLLEKKYEKLIKKLRQENKPLVWISETSTILSSCSSDIITFQKAQDFINEVKNSGSFPLDKNVYYFISAWLHISSFSLTDFLGMDPDVSDFLVDYQIPIIIDASMELDDVFDASYELFENTQGRFNQKKHYWRNIDKLTFYFVIGGEYIHRVDRVESPRTVKVNHCYFPTAFFHKMYPGSSLFAEAEKCRNQIFFKIKEKKVTNDTVIWQAFCRSPRLTRILFQLWAKKENLTRQGKFSRLTPCKNTFLEACDRTGILEKYQNRFDFLNENILSQLDNVYYVDQILDVNDAPVGLPFDSSTMFHIVLETCPIVYHEDFINTPMFLTEKTSMAILSGVPFITLGGNKIGKLLKQLGFKEYIGLEFPDHRHNNFFDELDYVIEKIKKILSLSLKEKQDLYDSWKENIMFNYDLYLSLNPQKLYLEFLETDLKSSELLIKR